MTDKEDDAKLALQRCGVTWPSDNSIRVISVFLRKAHNAALEEAAKVAETFYTSNLPGDHPKTVAAAIRALKN